jgi:transcriptional regulator with XRE-family HTH domain
MPVRPTVEPAWWTSGSIDGVAMRDALAGRDIRAVFRFLHQRGWSWAAIARATDIGEQRVREIANGKRRVENYDVYVRVAVGLNIPRDYLGVGLRPAGGDGRLTSVGSAADAGHSGVNPLEGGREQIRDLRQLPTWTREQSIPERLIPLQLDRPAPGPAGTTFAAARSEPVIGSWFSAPTPQLSTPGRGIPVASHDLDVARGVLGMFRQLDHTHGAGSFVRHLAVYIDTELASLLARSASGSSVASARSRLAAEFLELAGYQAVDAGRNGTAQGFYQRAVAAASMSGDTAYGGYLVGVSLGHLALHNGHPYVALTWARKAEAGLGTAASPATRAAVTAVSARALARIGQEKDTTAALLECERLLDAASPCDEPDWIRYFSHAYLSDEIAHCLHDLGRAPAARPVAESALEGVGASHVRRLAIDAALLASIWLRSGDLDQACLVGRQAVEYAARTSSGRCRQRVTALLADLSGYRLSPCVTELAQFARDVLPEATGVS